VSVIEISHKLLTPEMVVPTMSIRGTTSGLWCMELHTQPSCGLPQHHTNPHTYSPTRRQNAERPNWK